MPDSTETHNPPSLDAAMEDLEKELGLRPASTEPSREDIALLADPVLHAGPTGPRDPLLHAPERKTIADHKVPENQKHLQKFFEQSPDAWNPGAASPRPQSQIVHHRPPSATLARTETLRCDHCGSRFLTGMLFCAHCGGPPRHVSAKRKQYLFVEGFSTKTAEIRFKTWAREAGIPSPVLNTVLGGSRKAILTWDAPPCEAPVAIHWLREAGVQARFAPRGEHLISRYLQALRVAWTYSLGKILMVSALVGGLGVALYGSTAWLWLFSIAALFWSIWNLQKRTDQFLLDSSQILDRIGGLTKEQSSRVRALLQGIQDPEVRGGVTACLQSLQALNAHSRNLDDVLENHLHSQHEELRHLMEQYISVAEGYMDLEHYLQNTSNDSLERAIQEQKTLLPSAQSRAEASEIRQTIQSIEAQLQVHQDLARAHQKIKGKLIQQTARIDSLRARVLAIHLKAPSKRSDKHFESLIEQLKSELEILEETVHEVHP